MVLEASGRCCESIIDGWKSRGGCREAICALVEFNIDGFVPVGTQEGMVEVIEKKKGGRPRKYETEEEAKRMKAEQTKESNKRMAEEKKNAKKLPVIFYPALD
jgi:hypothetical protein